MQISWDSVSFPETRDCKCNLAGILLALFQDDCTIASFIPITEPNEGRLQVEVVHAPLCLRRYPLYCGKEGHTGGDVSSYRETTTKNTRWSQSGWMGEVRGSRAGIGKGESLVRF